MSTASERVLAWRRQHDEHTEKLTNAFLHFDTERDRTGMAPDMLTMLYASHLLCGPLVDSQQYRGTVEVMQRNGFLSREERYEKGIDAWSQSQDRYLRMMLIAADTGKLLVLGSIYYVHPEFEEEAQQHFAQVHPVLA